MKDKAWLEKELVSGLMKFNENPFLTEFDRGHIHGISVAQALVYQLDEPKITEEQAWNEEIARLSDYLLRNFEKEIGGDRNYETPVDAAIRLLGEKRKPVIPQFVADWIEKAKSYHSISWLLNYQNIKSWSHELTLWCFESGNEDNLHKLARAWLDGYTTEKEKLYRVRAGKSYVRFNLEGSIIGAKAVDSVVTLDSLSKLPFDYKKAVESGIITLVEVTK